MEGWDLGGGNLYLCRDVFGNFCTEISRHFSKDSLMQR